MSYDVIVVGGGIGGLTVAALLSARGASVCLLERQSQVGGCISRVNFDGHDFDPGMGVYSSWGAGEIHDRVFAELPVTAPKTETLESEYVVRLAGDVDVKIHRDDSLFFAELEKAFPECGSGAIQFYQAVRLAVTALQKSIPPSNVIGNLKALWSQRGMKQDLARAADQSAGDQLNNTSDRFKKFIDAQLRALSHTSLDTCVFLTASLALMFSRAQLYSIEGGPATLAERLEQSIRQAGGVVRLDTPVLRLAYDSRGEAIGVDLLSGEFVPGNVIVSNMTIWDTYGKLIGLKRTPPDLKKRLGLLQGNGAYLIYASMQETAASRLPGANFLIAPGLPDDDEEDDRGLREVSFATSFGSSPVGKKAITLKSSTPVEPWFAFQSSEADAERWDQEALEILWQRLHERVPELGGDIEVIETANPRTFYESSRRKLGRVMGVGTGTPLKDSHQTILPNVFMIGDTISLAPNLPAVTESALQLANELVKPQKQ